MRRWFLSYNSQDFELARRLASEIVRKDSGATIFFAPKDLRPGAYWMPTLAKEIAEATVFVLLIGKSGVGSWQTVEYLEAFDRRAKERDFPLILLLLDGEPAPGLPFLRQLHWVISSDPASELSVSQAMDAAVGSSVPAREQWRHTAPYRGLCAMTESDADFFFGRGHETADVIGALAATPDKLSVLLGNSGVGKSSLAQAGVLAALMGQGWPDSAESPRSGRKLSTPAGAGVFSSLGRVGSRCGPWSSRFFGHGSLTPSIRNARSFSPIGQSCSWMAK
jgi:hypothetical protein